MRIELYCFCGGRLAGSYPDEMGEQAVEAWENQHVGTGHRWIDYPSWAARAEMLTETEKEKAVAKAVITIEDKDDAANIEVDFDPPLSDILRTGPAQIMAMEIVAMIRNRFDVEADISFTPAPNPPQKGA